MSQSQFESHLIPVGIADAPDIENVPAAESMHALMEAVVEVHSGVRQILEALDPATQVDRMRALAPAAIELVKEFEEQEPVVQVVDASGMSLDEIAVECGQENADWLTDATPAPLDPSKVKAGDTVTVEVIPLHGPRYSLSGEVYRVDMSGPLWVGPVCITGPDEDIVRVTLTDHQPAPEPEPALPTTPGSLIKSEAGDLVFLTKAMWLDQDHDERNPSGWAAPWTQMVVIDPAAVDVAALVEEYQRAYTETDGYGYDGHARRSIAMRAALAHLGIEATS